MALCLGRKVNQSIHIGDDVRVVITGISGNRCTVRVEAPQDVAIVRGELVKPPAIVLTPPGGVTTEEAIKAF